MSSIVPLRPQKTVIKANLSKPKNPGGSWLVSFGDLLTLMLCFFLSLVCYGHIKPIPKDVDNNKNIINSDKLEKNEGMSKKAHPFGSEIASNHIVETETSLKDRMFFEGSDFTGKGSLADKAREHLHTFLEQYQGEHFVIRSCSLNEGESWYEALQQALLLRGELLAEKLQRNQLQVELLADDCEMLQSEATTKAVASIEVRA